MTAHVTTPPANRSHLLDDLRRRTSGRLTTPEDTDYVLASTPWTVNVAQRPLAVLEVRDADDVVAAVRWAVDHDAQVMAQPSGHGAGEALEEVLLLRTGALDGIEVDLERRTARVGAGVRAAQLNAALDGTGLTFLCGSNADPSVVGLTLTGGLSWFGRAYGVGSDSIVSVDLVDGLGRLRRVDATTDPELFWALRGGGGDFGVVTSLEVALHPAPAVYGGPLMWPAEQMPEVLAAFRAVTATAPEGLSVWFSAWNFPPLPELPEPLRGASMAGVVLTHLGTPEEAEALIAPLRAVDGVVIDGLRPVPIGGLGDVAGEPTDPTPSISRSSLLTDLDDATAEALLRTVGPGSGSPLAVVQVRHLGGALARTAEGAGCHGPVSEPYLVMAVGIPAVPGLEPLIEDRLDRLDEAVAGVASGRTLLNFLAHGEDPGRWWDAATRERLAAVERAVDPLATVRSNRPVQQ